MDLTYSEDTANVYKINTPVYQGPLDLLLQLIENAELDITTLALAQVTDQYLKHLEDMEDLIPDEISAFLVIAAKLIQIKSESLLPQQSNVKEEETDLGNELARQLIAYKRYKEIADILAERKELGYQTFIRLSSPKVDIKDNLDLGNFGVDELFSLASSIFQKDIERHSISTVVERPKVTIRDKINQISEHFKNSNELTFRELLGEKYTRLDIVIAFLALLELIKGDFILFVQEEMFDDIKMVKAKEPSEMQEYALRNLDL